MLVSTSSIKLCTYSLKSKNPRTWYAQGFLSSFSWYLKQSGKPKGRWTTFVLIPMLVMSFWLVRKYSLQQFLRDPGLLLGDWKERLSNYTWERLEFHILLKYLWFFRFVPLCFYGITIHSRYTFRIESRCVIKTNLYKISYLCFVEYMALSKI